MSQSVSRVGFLAGLAFCAYAGGDSAVSSEAETIGREASTIINHVEQSQALFGAKKEAISSLMALENECASDEATALHPDAVRMAACLLRVLPDDLPLPEFSPEPDGSISFDWIQSRTQLFSMSVGVNNRIAYAWLDGTNSGHGVDSFDGQQIPTRIRNGILSILTNGNAFLRAA